jgi:ABC-type spermidine/putrescine transport system permease subunit II
VLGWIGLGLLYLVLYAPLVTIALFSVNDSTVQSLPWAGFTTDWYRAIPDDEPLLDSLRYSLSVSLAAVALSAVVGTIFSLLLHHASTRAARLLELLIAVPVVVPGMVLGLSLAMTFRELGLRPGWVTVVVGHASFLVPIVTFLVLTRLRRLDPTLAQASSDLGADRWRTFLHVTFPQIRSAVLAACLLSLTLSFDDVIVTFFLVGNRPTLPVFIWSQTRFGFTPQINAIVTVIGFVSVVVIIAATGLISGDRGRRPARAA